MKQIIAGFVLVLVSTLSFADTPPSTSPSPVPPKVQTNSNLYLSLESDLEAQKLDQMRFNTKLWTQLKADTNYQKVKTLLTALYNHTNVVETIPLADGDSRSLQIVETGVNQPTNLVLLDPKTPQTPQVLYSNVHSGGNRALELESALPSQNGHYVALQLSADGSIDQMKVLIYDLTNQKMTSTQFNIVESNQIAWLDDHRVLYMAVQGENGTMLITDITTGQTTTSPTILQVLSDSTQATLVYTVGNQVGIYDKNTGAIVNLDGSDGTSTLVGVGPNSYFTYDVGTTSMGELRAISKSAGNTSQLVIPLSSNYLQQVTPFTGGMLAVFRQGAVRNYSVYDLNGQLIGQIPSLNCCSIKGLKWIVAGQTLDVALASEVVNTTHFTFNLKTQTWNQDPEQAMMLSRSVSVVTSIAMIASEDGTLIPTRLTHRSDLKPSPAPVLINSYGGFDETGYIDPSFSDAQNEFIQRGGILVSPALRGGNELGPAWHTAAMFTGKIKTFQDLASVAQWLVDQKLTTPNLIASFGASNGGLTVAATGLLYPDRFGLIIPAAGVDDLLGKDRLDATNGGWSEEYGDVATYASFLQTISPVELATHQGQLKFMIIDGSDDTRVNPVHSIKLARALEDFGGSINGFQLLSLRDAGHWMYSVTYQNGIGLQTDAIMWTALFDQYGWTP